MSEPAWSIYQEQVATFFRSIGLQAETNVHLEGARAGHDIDVLVTFTSAAITITWVVECKHWKRPVGKDRVLTLAGVMTDLGADRGLIVAESGFQAGAIRACANSNITLTSLEDLRANTADEKTQIDTAALQQRIAALYELTMGLWEWSAPSTPAGGISAADMIAFAGNTFELHALALPAIIAGRYPVILWMGGSTAIGDASALSTVLEPRLREIDAQAQALRHDAEVSYTRVRADVETLDAAVQNLLDCGRAMPRDLSSTASISTTSDSLPPDLSDDARSVLAFVNAMKRVGDIADSLRTTAPDRVRAGITNLMRYLIANTYAVFDDNRPDWDADQAALSTLTRHIHNNLEQAAHRAGLARPHPGTD